MVFFNQIATWGFHPSFERMKSVRLLTLAATFALFLGGSAKALAGSATGISGLYYTGVANNGSLLSGGATDSHWTVAYARVNGLDYYGTSTYTGAARVVSGSYVDGAWVQNTSSAQWITAPGASTSTSGTSTNIGGDYLPGNGTTGTNDSQYVYELDFTITGTGSGSVTNNISINMTIAADDNYSIYVNPAGYTLGADGITFTTAASASGTSAWNNTTSLTLKNYGTGDNADFVIGTNKIYIVVNNTNGVGGSSSATALNPSGLLVYQVGSAVTIDGKPVPEVGTWLPLIGAVGLYGGLMVRRRRQDKKAG